MLNNYFVNYNVISLLNNKNKITIMTFTNEKHLFIKTTPFLILNL